MPKKWGVKFPMRLKHFPSRLRKPQKILANGGRMQSNHPLMPYVILPTKQAKKLRNFLMPHAMPPNRQERRRKILQTRHVNSLMACLTSARLGKNSKNPIPICFPTPKAGTTTATNALRHGRKNSTATANIMFTTLSPSIWTATALKLLQPMASQAHCSTIWAVAFELPRAGYPPMTDCWCVTSTETVSSTTARNFSAITPNSKTAVPHNMALPLWPIWTATVTK